MSDNHEKAFELTKPKTPEQIKREALNAMMPQLRRDCSRDKRLKKCVGAKWLFGVLTDNSFMYKFGGDGSGRVYCSLKDLNRLYGHDEDTLAAWRDKLISTGWIWFQERWPKSCWGVAGACDQPELPFTGSEFTEIIARASSFTQPPAAVGYERNGKTVDSGEFDRNGGLDQPPAAVTSTASGGESDRSSRFVSPSLGVTVNGQGRTDQPPAAVILTEPNGHSNPQTAVPATEPNGHIREIPVLGSTQNGEKGELATPEKEFQEWLKTLDGMYPSHLRVLERNLMAEWQKAKSQEARATWQRRLVAVRMKQLGGPVEDRPKPATKSVRKESKPTMTFEQQQAAWTKEKAALAAALNKKTAAKAAART